MAKYDVYWAVMHFADKPWIKKERPVLQIKDNQNEKGAFANITSKDKYKDKPNCVVIEDISQTDLYKKWNIVRLDRRSINKPNLRYSGRLTESDIRKIQLAELVDESEIEYRYAEDFDDEFDMNYSLLEVLNEK